MASWSCREKNEAVLALPDLSIPLQLQLLDHDGKPMLDPQGQPIVDINELYYNYRTGELFTHLFPSVQGVIPGDILDVGTRVFNNWANRPEAICADAPSTTANSVLIYSGNTDSGSVALMPGIVPPVPCNTKQGGFIYTTMQLNSPGFFRVCFAANHDRKVLEHDFMNNYTEGASASLFDRSITGGIVVSEGVASRLWVSSNIPTCEVARGTCFTQFDSGTMLENYLYSPLARFMQNPVSMAKFIKFKEKNPGKPFLLN